MKPTGFGLADFPYGMHCSLFHTQTRISLGRLVQ